MSSLRHLAAAALLAAVSAAPASALTIGMIYTDSTVPGGNDVGTGVLTLGSDPGNGAFLWTSLDSPSLSFSFDAGAFVFSDADFTTPVGVIEVILAGVGVDRTFRFDSDESGPQGGSLDLQNGGGDVLSHQPGGGDLYFMRAFDGTPDYFGLYLPDEADGGGGGAAVPLPPAAAMLLFGLAGLGWMRRARG